MACRSSAITATRCGKEVRLAVAVAAMSASCNVLSSTGCATAAASCFTVVALWPDRAISCDRGSVSVAVDALSSTAAQPATNTCALVPPKPNELTAATGDAVVQGAGWVGNVNREPTSERCGFGWL